MLADGWCLCNVHRWHIGWWVGAKRCSAGRYKAHRTHLIIIIYCKGRKFLSLKLSKVLKQCRLKGPNQMSPSGSITDISEPKELFSSKKKYNIPKQRKMFLFHLFSKSHTVTSNHSLCLQLLETTGWSLLGPGVEVGLAPNIMKGINIFTIDVIKDFSCNYDKIIQVL